MHRALPALAVSVVAGATLLVPGTAAAQTNSYWSTTHHRTRSHTHATDPGNDITWTVLDHKVILTTPDLLVVPFQYRCGTPADPGEVEYDPAAFQTVFNGATARAYTDVEGTTSFPTFTCDGTQHVTDVVLPAQDGTSFETGNLEIGLVNNDTGPTSEPTFEHAVTGYNQLHDPRAKVTVTVDATHESTRPGSKITVKGTLQRDGRPYRGKTATLCFQTKAGDPATKISRATANSRGRLRASVTVTGPGTYFWTTTSTKKTQAGASPGDYAAA